MKPAKTKTSPKTIVIDGRMIGWTGVGIYTRRLLENLQRQDARNRYIVLLQPADRERFTPTAPNFHILTVKAPPYSFAEQLRLPWLLYRLRPDLVHFPAPNAPLLYLRRFIVTAHDLTLIKHRNVRRHRWVYELKFWAFRLVITGVVRHAATIIATTNIGRAEVAHYFGQRARAKTVVTPLAADPPAAATGSTAKSADTKPLVAPPYLLYVGNYYPYKNLGRLIEAMPAILRRHPSLKLVLVGDTDYFGTRLHRLCEQFEVTEQVVFTGFISDAERNQLYRHASLYVFPSLSEGFGIPGLEAMSYSLPVVSSSASCLPEVYGDAAAYFDPEDPVDMARVISQTLSSQATLTRLKAAGATQLKKYSWEQTTELTLAAYTKLLK